MPPRSGCKRPKIDTDLWFQEGKLHDIIVSIDAIEDA
jgi:hypothetical protein